MATLLLVVIYLSFISLGVPDSLLGTAWPVLYRELGVPLASYQALTEYAMDIIIKGETMEEIEFGESEVQRIAEMKVL